jgi:transcriptional regulator with XRE-family HTH domain
MPDTQLPIAWHPTAPNALRTARRAWQHSQKQCAQALSVLGAERVSQVTISEWERGLIHSPAPAALAAIQAYVETAPASTDEAWQATMNSLANQPMLSDLQSAFVLGVIKRVKKGPPLTIEDHVGLANTAKLIGLEWRVPRGR